MQKHIERLIARINQALNHSLNRIIHHEQFQALESAWRGLELLTKTLNKHKRLKVRMLNLSFQEFSKDLLLSPEIERSKLFQKIYIEELDQAGGEPFGVLMGDYYFSHQTKGKSIESIEVLQHMAKISAAAFMPFVTGISPNFLGLNSFSELNADLNLEAIFKAHEYHRWNRFRQDENAHFIALTLPRVLMRLPYNTNGVSVKNRFFKESIEKHEDYLWGNACYLYVGSIMHCVNETGWFTTLRGLQNKESMSAMIVRDHFIHDSLKNVSKISTECLVSDRNEKRFSDLGFIAGRDHRYLKELVFYSSQTVKWIVHPSEKINTSLQYVLCVSRFAHYIKVIIREKVGSFTSIEACESFMTKWLNQYCSSSKGQSFELLSKKPLAAFKLSIQEIQGSPGKFFCSMLISPHVQFDDIQSQLKMVTKVRLN